MKLGSGQRIRWRIVIGIGVLFGLVATSDVILRPVLDQPPTGQGADLAGADVS